MRCSGFFVCGFFLDVECEFNIKFTDHKQRFNLFSTGWSACLFGISNFERVCTDLIGVKLTTELFDSCHAKCRLR